MIKKRYSLAFRITVLALTAVLVSILIIGMIGIYAVKSEGDADASRHLNLLCDDSAKGLNEFLMSVEQSVGLAARYAADDVSVEELMKGGVVGDDGWSGYDDDKHQDEAANARFKQYLDEHIQRILDVMQSTANHTHGVYAFYYRINQGFTKESSGFFYAKTTQSSFSLFPLTDTGAYEKEDISRVGWYYIPLKNGGHTWIHPYYNKNLERKILSYEIPIYKAGTFIGIVGMDLDYDTLVDQIRNVSIFDTGYVYLTTENGDVVWHPTVTEGNIMDYCPELEPMLRSFSSVESSVEVTIPYTFNGIRMEMAFDTLFNGMKVIATAPINEINASWHYLVAQIVVAGLLVMSLSAVAMILTMRQVTLPLQRLTEASQHLAEGNYDIELDYSIPDEVGMLTNVFKKLTEHFKVYISDLNSRVYKDALTGVRNKGGFDIYMRKLNDSIRSGDEKQKPKLAIIMFDTDELKRINDTFGHDKGDIFLQNVCHQICNSFSHSPVFRIGGDEFVAILQHEDYHRRGSLINEFDQIAASLERDRLDPWEHITVSRGIAIYDPKVDADAESVFNRADALMYEDKKNRKGLI